MEAGVSNVNAQRTLNALAKLNSNIKLNTTTLDYRFPSNMSQTNGIYQMPDEKGESYIFRGDIDYNYLKFAGFYWRILRINGDGTLRLVYDGTSAHGKGDSSNDRVIGTSAFNATDVDNAHVGYMYGTPNSITYVETHANTNNSTIKTYIDNWYKTNIADKEYSKYIADEVFCNDRSIAGELKEPYDMNGFSQKGYGDESTFYGTLERFSYARFSPSLICKQKNDAFTVSDSANGNGNLTYPVGMLTTDEVVLAGGSYAENSDYYLTKGISYWTLSPYAHYKMDGNTTIFVDIKGNGNYYLNLIPKGVVPVINLSNDSVTKLTGNGTMTSPFEIAN